jgi:hypothetical protein
MATRAERRSGICPECGAAALIEHVEVREAHLVVRVERYTTCHNIDCATRHAA